MGQEKLNDFISRYHGKNMTFAWSVNLLLISHEENFIVYLVSSPNGHNKYSVNISAEPC